ncbi:MAG: 4Fe-4S dicluster domain-containing protein [Acidobacteria bacterium]|nr:4Fe-4S dicluster domain-containing protein [Acidobacteriota bacterium]
MKRRDFLKLMGMATGAAVTVSCGSRSKIVSELHGGGPLPGEGVYVPSVCTACPAGCAVRARVVDGWPVKLEGEHGLCIRGQARLARLYHPERLRGPRSGAGKGKPVPWDQALATLKGALDQARREGKTNVWLHGHVPGTLSRLLDDFCRRTGTVRCGEAEALQPGALRRACQDLGMPGVPLPDLSGCDTWVTVGADLFEASPDPVEFARQYGVASGREGFRWFHLEPGLGLTGLAAGTRLAVRPGSEADILEWLFHRVRHRADVEGLRNVIPHPATDKVAATAGLDARQLEEIARALDRAKHPAVVGGLFAVAQRGGDAAARASVALLAALGLPGRHLRGFLAAPRFDLPVHALPELLESGRCGVLLVSHLADAALPAEVSKALTRAAFRVGFTDLPPAWGGACDLLLPPSDILETWGDAEPLQNRPRAAKPALAKPIHDTLPLGEILLKLSGAGGTWKAWLLEAWKARGLDFEAPPAPGPAGWSPDPEVLAGAFANPAARPVPPSGATLLLMPTARGYDGRDTAIPLLREVPDPLASVSYGAFALLHPATAAGAGLSDGATARIEIPAGAVDAAVRTVEAVPPGVVLLPLEHRGPLAIPWDPKTGDYHLRLDNVRLARSSAALPVAVLSGGRDARGRGITEPAPVHHAHAHGGSEAHAHPADEKQEPIPGKAQPTLYPPHAHKDYRWGLAVDLARCTGCSACVAACYVENNVALTGFDEHVRGREMSWLRIQPYDLPGARMEFVPMMCQQCDHAPCEPVCPVYAAYHSDEGLNVQVYNRCVGTRYCANNCPYKVRRFNWFDHAWAPPSDKGLNPDVSVRPRGVMEKCTFCIQRIRWAKDRARDEGRKVRDGEIVPACAQACPAGAIVFGNLLDPEAEVSKWARSERAYRILEEVGTRPAVYYLRRV